MAAGVGRRIAYAFRAFFSILFKSCLADDVLRDMAPQAAPPPPASASAPTPVGAAAALAAAKAPVTDEAADRAVQMLALFQRDGRLVDFFLEDLSGYSDDQVGAAVRELHASCRATLTRYVTMEPVLASNEGQVVTVPMGVDAGTVKLMGNVTGNPPFRGILRHRGWRVVSANLPPLPDHAARPIVAPAEVEIE